MDVNEWKAKEKTLVANYQKRFGEPINLDVCQGCPFMRPLHCHNRTRDNFCAYILLAGHSRGPRCTKRDLKRRRKEYIKLPPKDRAPYGRGHYPDLVIE